MANERFNDIKQREGWRRTFRSRSNGQLSRVMTVGVQSEVFRHKGISKWLSYLDRRNPTLETSLTYVPDPENRTPQFSVKTPVFIGELVGNLVG